MDEVNELERQVAVEIRVLMGPIRPVDDAAIFTAIRASQSPRRRMQSVFNATRLVVAGTVAALFGGFLLAAMPSQPRADDLAPAASAPVDGQPVLLYQRGHDVYGADEDGTDPMRLFSIGPGPCDASVGRVFPSPDGRHLAYRTSWDNSCPGTVSIVDLAGHLVASVPGQGWDLAWSPDGTRIVTWIGFGSTIGVYGIDGTLQAELDASSVFAGGDRDPRFAPDTTAVLVPARIDSSSSEELVARLPLDGGPPEIPPATDPLSNRTAAFSPDGTRAASEGTAEQLVVSTLDGTSPPVEFFFEPGDRVDAIWARRPVWSPTSDRVAVVTRRFSTDGAGNQVPESARLWVADPMTGLATVVASADGGDDLAPVMFSADGDRVLVKGEVNQVPSLLAAASDGSGSTVLVTGVDVGAWVPPVRAGDDPARP